MKRWIVALGLTAAAVAAAIISPMRGGRRRRPRVDAVAPADLDAAIRATARDVLGGESDQIERALLAWADLESGFDVNTIVQAATGRAWGLFQLLDRYFLPIAIEKALLPEGSPAEGLLLPVVNIRLGVENTLNLLNHPENQAGSFRSRFLRARSRALGCDFACRCAPATCARVTRRGLEFLDKWGVA